MAESDIIFGSVAIRRPSQGQREPLGGDRQRAADSDQRPAGKLSRGKCAWVTREDRATEAEVLHDDILRGRRLTRQLRKHLDHCLGHGSHG